MCPLVRVRRPLLGTFRPSGLVSHSANDGGSDPGNCVVGHARRRDGPPLKRLLNTPPKGHDGSGSDDGLPSVGGILCEHLDVFRIWGEGLRVVSCWAGHCVSWVAWVAWVGWSDWHQWRNWFPWSRVAFSGRLFGRVSCTPVLVVLFVNRGPGSPPASGCRVQGALDSSTPSPHGMNDIHSV